jgi:hypothetical protein
MSDNPTRPEPDEDTTFTSDDELQGGYFIQTMSAFWQRTDLSLEAKGVYALLLTYAGKNDKGWPGQEKLSGQTGLSKNTLRERIEELKDAKLLSVKRRGQGKPNLYHLHTATVKPISANSGIQEAQNLDIKNSEAQDLSFKKLEECTSKSSGFEQELYSEETYSINNTTPLPPKAIPAEKPLVVDAEKKNLRDTIRTLIPGPPNQIISGATNSRLHEIVDNNPAEWVRDGFRITASRKRLVAANRHLGRRCVESG